MAALAVLLLAWIVIPPHSVPLYDGIGAPDEPYRYVAPPAGAKHTVLPVTASASDDAVNGTNRHAFYVSSAEVGPQILLFIGIGSLEVPAAATSLRVDVTPLAPDVPPAGGAIDGNIYRVSGVGHTGSTEVGAVGVGACQSADCTITMRATTAHQPAPSFIYRETTAAAWHRVQTVRVGNDVYRADFDHVGGYALAFFASDAAAKGGTLMLVVKAGGIALAALIALIVVVRLNRRRLGEAP